MRLAVPGRLGGRWRQLELVVAPVADAYAEIFFLSGTSTGLLLLLISLLDFNIALSGLTAVLVAFLFAMFIGLKDSFLASGYFVYNSLLVGFSIGFLYKLSPFVIFLVAISAILTFLLTLMTARIFYLYLGLPILSIPFTIVSSLIYLASAKFPNLYVTSLHNTPQYQLWFFLQPLEHYFIALGSIVFMPNWQAGLLISAVILYRSRIIWLLSLGGYLWGVMITAALIGSWQLALLQSGHFNFILIAVALGCIFTIVSLRSLVLALIGVSMATLIIGAANTFWSQYAIPIFTLPFILVTLSILFALRLSGKRWMPAIAKDTPEETLEHAAITASRTAATIPIALPFAGEWHVWQGFDGQWTHQGNWKHAYDFVIKDDQGRTFADQGILLEQYHSYKKPVYSPVRGKVITVVNSLPDNPIGMVDSVNSWGNFIVLWDERGIYVEISHFSTGSIAVYEGQWVASGEYLGLCGNSGYSPEPHIHIQVQATHWPGAHTIPFCFQHYQQGREFYPHGLPAVGTQVTRHFPDAALAITTGFLLGEVVKYRVFSADRLLESIDISVCLEVDGTFYFYHRGSKLYFYRDENQFRCLHMTGQDPYLKILYMAACNLPYCASPSAVWSDQLQPGVLVSGWKRLWHFVLHATVKRPLGFTARYERLDAHQVRGEIITGTPDQPIGTHLWLDPKYRFRRIRMNKLILERYE